MKTVKFWGQEARAHRDKSGNSVWTTSIGKPHYETGKPVSVGLNEKFLDNAIVADATLAIRIESMKRRIFVMAKDFKKESWVHNQPSVRNPGETFKIFMLPIKRYLIK